MKKTFGHLVLIICIFTACQREMEPEQESSTPLCGTKEAMESLSPGMKQLLVSESGRTQFQVPSLLFYLDFDGATVFPGLGSYDRTPLVAGTRICPPAPLTSAQITELVRLISDDFSPFNITVTTDLSTFLAQSPGLRHLCVVTTSPLVIGLPTGIAGVAPFTCSRISNSPCFAFGLGYSDNLDAFAHVISHELAHTVGLDHQGLYPENCQSTLAEYHPGFGEGDLSFHPIMGIQNSSGISNWYQQSCYRGFCGSEGQDDFLLLNQSVQLRPDDHPDEIMLNSATLHSSFEGVLDKQGDVDIVKINFTAPGPVVINSHGNVDLKVTVLTAGGQVMGEYIDPGSLHVTIPSVPGLRFLKIESGGNPNISAHFLTGGYSVSF